MRDPRHILITGGSSGIGEALARAYAAPGISLALTGRDAARLEGVAAACRAAGATVTAGVVDVADRTAMRRWVESLDDARPLDLVIANAGIDGSNVPEEERPYALFEVNVAGVFNTVLPALPRMRARRRGQIAIVSSLAGFRGMPGAVAYSASKAAVRAFGEGLRGRHAAEGVEISVVTPGFVRSRMTSGNRFSMPLLWPAERAAAHIKRKLARNRGRIAFPWRLYAAVWLMNVLPQGLVDRATARLPRKV